MASRIEWATNSIDTQMYIYLRGFMWMHLNHWSRSFEYPWIMVHGNFSPGEWVLDAGGGNICCLLQYSMADKGAHVINVDIDESQFHRADKSALPFVADIRKLPFLDNSFQKVVCCSTLEHIENPEDALFELWRVLAPKGRLIVTMDIPEQAFRHEIGNWVHTTTEDKAEEMLAKFGLSIPPKPDNILVGKIGDEGVIEPPIPVRVLCFYVDKLY